MSILGDKYSVELKRRNTRRDGDWTMLVFTDSDGKQRGVKWHTDATDTELEFAFRRFADSLKPRPPKPK